VYPVNARGGKIAGRPAFATLSALPEPPDCVAIALPAEAVEPALAEAAQVGAGAAVVFAGGYAETATAAGRSAQARISALAAATGLRIVGPNTAGLANLVTGAHVGFAEFPHRFEPRTGAIALVSQSGALGMALAQAGEHGASSSPVLTCGNSVDVDVAGYLAFLAGAPEPGAVALAFARACRNRNALCRRWRRFGARASALRPSSLAGPAAGQMRSCAILPLLRAVCANSVRCRTVAA